MGLVVDDCRAADIPVLVARLPSPTGRAGIHADRYQAQQVGTCTYLVARLDGQLAGHVLIEWSGCQASEVYHDFLGVPEICSLLVHRDLRGKGIGTALIAAAERRAAERGRRRVGMGVATDNTRAQALYQRLGYRPARAYLNRWTVMGADGIRRHKTEPSRYLIKDL